MEQDIDAAGRILRALRFRPRGMTITEIARQTHITRNSVSKHLEVLRSAGKVDMRAVGNAKVYSPAQRVPLSAFLCFTRNLIVVLDMSGTIIQINDHLLSITGMKKEEIIGENIRDVPVPVVSGEEAQKVIEGVEREQVVTDVHHMHNGVDHFYRMQVIPTVFEDGERGRTIVLEDNTEKRCYVRNMEFLAKTAMEFVNFPVNTDIYERIAEMIHELIPEGRVIVQSYDEVTNCFAIRGVVNSDFRNGLSSLIGREPVGMTVPFDEVSFSPFLEKLPVMERNLCEISLSPGGDGDSLTFSELMFRQIPADVCEEIAVMQDIGKAYMTFLVWNEQLLGNVRVFLSSHEEIRDICALESFIRQASIAISRRITEERLYQSNERFREVVEQSPFATAIINTEGHFSYINHSFTKILGYTMADIENGREWLHKVFPDGDTRQSVIDAWRLDCNQAGINKVCSRTFPVRCRNGEMRKIHMRAQMLCDRTFYLTLEDNTELWRMHNIILSYLSGQMKESGELQLKDLALASLGCGIAIADECGCIGYVNPAFLSLWGFGSVDEVAGMHTAELWNGSAGSENSNLLQKQNHAWSGALRGVKKDQSSFPVYGMLNAVMDLNDQVAGLVGLFVDIIPADAGWPDQIVPAEGYRDVFFPD